MESPSVPSGSFLIYSLTQDRGVLSRTALFTSLPSAPQPSSNTETVTEDRCTLESGVCVCCVCMLWVCLCVYVGECVRCVCLECGVCVPGVCGVCVSTVVCVCA